MYFRPDTNQEMAVDRLYYPALEAIQGAAETLLGVAVCTPLQKSDYLSQKYGATIYVKREDLQPVRSYKIRGAFHKIAGLNKAERAAGVVCASAGNHAQGFAYACRKLGIKPELCIRKSIASQNCCKIRCCASFFDFTIAVLC